MKIRSVLLVIALVLAIGATTSACSAEQGCAVGVDTADAAVRGLVDAARAASEPADVCRWIAPGWTVTDADLKALQSAFDDQSDDDLVIRTGDQLGTDSSVDVSTSDGNHVKTFDATSDSHGKWTVAYGTLSGQGDGIPVPTVTSGVSGG